jgi:hypothetical protein
MKNWCWMEEFIEKMMIMSLAGLLVFYYYVKYLLVRRGLKIHLLFDYGKDYQSLKKLIENESNQKVKNKYQNALFFLKVSAVVLVGSTICGVIFTKIKLGFM